MMGPFTWASTGVWSVSSGLHAIPFWHSAPQGLDSLTRPSPHRWPRELAFAYSASSSATSASFALFSRVQLHYGPLRRRPALQHVGTERLLHHLRAPRDQANLIAIHASCLEGCALTCLPSRFSLSTRPLSLVAAARRKQTNKTICIYIYIIYIYIYAYTCAIILHIALIIRPAVFLGVSAS